MTPEDHGQATTDQTPGAPNWDALAAGSDWMSAPERMRRCVARILHATWPERPGHFCRDNGCQLGYLELMDRMDRQHFAEVHAALVEAKRLLSLRAGRHDGQEPLDGDVAAALAVICEALGDRR